MIRLPAHVCGSMLLENVHQEARCLKRNLSASSVS